MESNANGLRPLCSLTPTTPPMGNAPNQEGARIRIGDVQGPEASTGSGNLTGHVVKVGRAVRVINAVRAANAATATSTARVGNAPKAADVARAGRAVSMKYGSQECGFPNWGKARVRGAAKKIGLTSHPVAARMHPATVMSR